MFYTFLQVKFARIFIQKNLRMSNVIHTYPLILEENGKIKLESQNWFSESLNFTLFF